MKSITQEIIDCFKRGNKVLLIGSGGSAALCQEMAAEFICKFEHERKPLPAIALTTDSSILTAISNDFGYKEVFSRQIEALGKQDDILIIFSTSFPKKYSFSLDLAESVANIHFIKVIIAPQKGTSTAHIQEFQHEWMHDTVRDVERAFL